VCGEGQWGGCSGWVGGGGGVGVSVVWLGVWVPGARALAGFGGLLRGGWHGLWGWVERVVMGIWLLP